MDHYKVIYDKLLKLIENGEKKFVIYPMGRNGALTKTILDTRFGIKDILMADNILSEVNEDICDPKELTNMEGYMWLITSENYALSTELLKIITPLNISEDRICVIFSTNINQYGEDYKVLSKLGKVANSEPSYEFLEVIKKKKNEGKIISVAEIGVDYGATSVEACKLLGNKDEYYLFDFEDRTNVLKEDLCKVPDICCEIKTYGNTRKKYDSYCYTLCDVLFDMRNRNLNGIFDAAYLDGLHGFNVDGLALCLLKELMKPEGFIVIDDLDWTWKECIAELPESKSEHFAHWTSELWTEGQISEPQVRRAVNAFMVNDKSYEEVMWGRSINPERRIIYKKK